MDDHNEERMEEAYDEVELSDDEFEELSFDDLLDRVESDDPSLTSVKVSTRSLIQNDDNDYRHRSDRMNVAIGRNTQLKALRFDGWGINVALAMNLFRGIACNQSIKRFHFNYCVELENVCSILTPLFKNNQVERIQIHFCNLSPESIRSLATSLAMFDSLKEFTLERSGHPDNPDYHQAARDFMQALSGHSRLTKLNVSSTNVGKLGCSALADDLLSNPNINLEVLDLASNNLGDDAAVDLASGIAGNTSLKEINLADNYITQAGWQALFDALSNSSCRLERLFLNDNYINDAAAQFLSTTLVNNTMLKTLNLGEMRGITHTGWRVLFDFLHSQTCALDNLHLSGTDFTDDEMTSLIDVLASNMSLKSLDLSFNTGATGATWQRLFLTVLASPSSELEKLDLGYCGINDNINDTAIRVLTNALVNNTKLKVLNLNCTEPITNAGWETFVGVLESPHTALEKLDLGDNGIDDATCTALLNSLASNKKLKNLVLDHSADWDPPVSVFCNSDSIMSTYNSNHSLQKVDHGYQDGLLPAEFESLLQINRENSPSQSARLKITKTHFSCGFITQPFVDMDLDVLPYAMAWMCRDGRAGGVNGHFYGFIRSMASLFEKAGNKGTSGLGVNSLEFAVKTTPLTQAI